MSWVKWFGVGEVSDNNDKETLERIQKQGRVVVEVLKKRGGQATVNLLAEYNVKPEKVKEKTVYLRFDGESGAHEFMFGEEGKHLRRFESALSVVMDEPWKARALVSGLLSKK